MSEPESGIEKRIDQEAWKRGNGDLALWFHHRTLLEGQEEIKQAGAVYWNSYLRTKKLEKYITVEQSVIQGWRIYIRHTTGIEPSKQADVREKNRFLVLDWLRRKGNGCELAEVFKRRAKVFYDAAESGDTDFFREVGRLISDGKQSEHHITKSSYAFNVLSRWLTERYWLMPAKLVSGLIATDRGVSDDEKNLKSFLSFKSRYRLMSHKPTLISHLEREGEHMRDVLTKSGRLLLG